MYIYIKITNGNYINPLFINNNNKIIKLIIISIVFSLFIITFLKVNNRNTIEIKIISFIKHKKIKKIINNEKELPIIKKYIQLLKQDSFQKNIYYYSNIVKPKISFISSVYNKEKYITSFISSIQNQNLKEFELILVDDGSSDNSVKLINNYIKNDKRIKLIKNKNNMGSLFSRYIGAMFSIGEYVIFVDSDDIILKEGISKVYNYIKKKDLDIVEFNYVFEDNNISIKRKYDRYYGPIFQPILSYIFYYKKNEGMEYNTALWDKLIKREIVIKSLNYIGLNYLYKKIIIENDVILLFSFFNTANSYQYINELGYYYYFKNNDSITNTRYEKKKSNQIIYSIFSNIKFLYEKTKYTNFDKYFCIYKLYQGYNRYKICFNYINNGFEFIENVLNQLLNSNYVSLEHKLRIRNISKEIFININKKNKTI